MVLSYQMRRAMRNDEAVQSVQANTTGKGGGRMSDDLISREAAIKAVDRHTREDGTLDDDISIILEEVKTGFDKEKVIDELKEEGCIIDNEAGNRAIEIIKKGGAK